MVELIPLLHHQICFKKTVCSKRIQSYVSRYNDERRLACSSKPDFHVYCYSTHVQFYVQHSLLGHPRCMLVGQRFGSNLTSKEVDMSPKLHQRTFNITLPEQNVADLTNRGDM